MHSKGISFEKTGFFSPLILDYLKGKEELKPFYANAPSIEGFQWQLSIKSQRYSLENRVILSSVLQKQYQDIQLSSEVIDNISSLKGSQTFTVTTGHQLSLFTGPLYFIYKIITTINLAEILGKTFPEYRFVPVYWMASEDHDFEEINHFFLNGKRFNWSREAGGPVGRFSNMGLDSLYAKFKEELGSGDRALFLTELFHKSYLSTYNLAQATRVLVNELFGRYGLVILDGDDPVLKKSFVPWMQQEVNEQIAYNAVKSTSKRLERLGYGIQVNPREINLFYIQEGYRERIVKLETSFATADGKFTWSENEFHEEIINRPENFSPNVLLRPLYQEVVLPNLAYVGGAGELAYWLQLKDLFDLAGVPYPIPVLRNSCLIVTAKQEERRKRLELDWEELFISERDLVYKKTRLWSTINIDFTAQRNHLKQQFRELYDLAAKTDKSFLGAVAAQEAKQIKGLDRLENRLLKAERRNMENQISRLLHLKKELFPNSGLQERQINFSEAYMLWGEDFIPSLLHYFAPIEKEFLVLIGG